MRWLYAEAFEALGRLHRLEAFASHHGADFYGLPRNTDRITLNRRSWRVPDTLAFGDGALVPFRAGADVEFTLAE